MSNVEYIPPVDSWIWFPRMNIEPFQNETEPKLYPHAYVKMVDISILESLIAIIRKQDEALKFYEIGDRMFDDREWDYHDGRLVPVGEYGTKAGDARARTEIKLKRLGVEL